MSYFRQQLEDWLKTIEVEADAVADVGGASNPVIDRVKRWEVKDYVIIDSKAEEAMVEPHHVADLNEQWCCGFLKMVVERFDVAFCLEVMEYVWNPVVALHNLHNLLKRGGILYISFPFLYPYHEPVAYDCLRYTRGGIERLMENAGFRILELRERIMRGESFAHYWKMIESEGMHPAKTVLHREIGYLVKAIK